MDNDKKSGENHVNIAYSIDSGRNISYHLISQEYLAGFKNTEMAFFESDKFGEEDFM